MKPAAAELGAIKRHRRSAASTSQTGGMAYVPDLLVEIRAAIQFHLEGLEMVELGGVN